MTPFALARARRFALLPAVTLLALVAAVAGAAPARAATVDTIPTAALAAGLAASPDGSRLYGSDYAGAAILEIDPENRAVTRTFPLPAGNDHPTAMAVSPDGAKVYALTETSVVELDAATGAATRVFGALETLNGRMTIAPDGSAVYASSPLESVLHTIDLRSGTVASRSLPHSPTGLAATRDGRKLYLVTIWTTPTSAVDVLDLGTGTISQIVVPTTAGIIDIVEAPDGKRVYATTALDGVAVIDTATDTLVATVPVPAAYLLGIAISPDGRWVHAVGVSGTLHTISTATGSVVATNDVGSVAQAIAIGPGGGSVFVSTDRADGASPHGVTVLPVPLLPGGDLSAGAAGSAYAAAVTPAGLGPFAFTASGLPDGLVIDPANGTITGVPSRIGDFSVTVSVSNGVLPAIGEYAIHVAAAPEPPSVPGGPLPAGRVGSPYASTIVPSGGTGPFRFSAAGLPAGLSIDPVTGAIAGTLTAPGEWTVTVTVTNAAGSASADYTLGVPTAAETPPAVGGGGGDAADGPITDVPERRPPSSHLAATGSVLPFAAAAVAALSLLAGAGVLVVVRTRPLRRAAARTSSTG